MSVNVLKIHMNYMLENAKSTLKDNEAYIVKATKTNSN